MPDRSASDRSQPGERAATGPADRLSLTVSALLIGGLLLASVALYENAKLDKPKPLKRPPAPVAQKKPTEPAAHQSSPAAMVIRLPPPPAPPGAPAKKMTTGPKRIPLKPAQRTVEKPRVVDPLKRIAVAKPVSAPAATLPPRIKPLKPADPAPAKMAQARPRPKPARQIKTPGKQSTESAKAVVDGTQNRRAGGVLLRLLEHGQGPTIEIAWPQRAAARRALYRQLTQCYGVKAAVLAGGTKLFGATGTAGETWAIDMDRFSGFIRSPQGEAIAAEARVFASIADRHGLTDWRPVRVFPRHVDAALLGGLGAVLGPQYKSARQIRAAYRLDRTRLILGDFTVDGRRLTGTVTLPLPRGQARGPGCD